MFPEESGEDLDNRIEAIGDLRLRLKAAWPANIKREGPRGDLVGSKLDLSAVGSKFRSAVSALNLAHGLPSDFPMVSVRIDPFDVTASNPSSEYIPGGVGTTQNTIIIRSEVPDQNLELIRQMGQLVNNLVLGEGATSGTDDIDSKELSLWRSAVDESDAVLSLRRLHEGLKGGGNRIVREALADALDYGNIFSRSYAQYVIVKSRSSTLKILLGVHRRQLDLFPLVWQNEDFMPIARQVQLLLIKNGLCGGSSDTKQD